jgi:drug/metabolite transporter (DMT)-like permease
LVIYLALFSVGLFRRHYRPGQWLALLSVVAGIVLVSIDGDNTDSTFLGVICMVIGEFAYAVQETLEEWILKDKAGQEPFYVMGCEGSWGLLFTSVMLATAKYWKCPSLIAKQCVDGHIDSFHVLTKQLSAQPSLIF